MDEYWLCPNCSSMVRRISNRCYKCNCPRPAVTGTVRLAGERMPGTVTPGYDESLRPAAQVILARHRYQPVGALAFVTVLALMALLAAGAVRYWSVQAIRILDGKDPASMPNLHVTLDRVASALSIAEPFIGLAAGALFLTFLAVSLANVPAVGAGSGAPHWFGSTLDWFIPIRNLIQPYRTVRDLFARLAIPGATGTKIVGAWWACCLTWYVLTYLPIYLQALEIFIGLAAAILMFIEAAGAQPHWSWITSPADVILFVLLAAVVGPTGLFLGNSAVVPSIGVSNWPHTLPGVYIIDDILEVLPHLDLIGFAAYVLAIVFLMRIVVELADRQRIRFKWLTVDK